MAPFAERDGDLANAWMEGLGDVIVPREPLLPLSRSVNSKLTTLCPRLDAWLAALPAKGKAALEKAIASGEDSKAAFVASAEADTAKGRAAARAALLDAAR